MAMRQPASEPRKHSLVAVYEDAAQARAAVKALERAGVDGVHIGIDSMAEVDPDTRREDRRGIGHVFRRVVAGVVIGSVAGALLGFLGGIMYNVVTGGELLDRAVPIAVIACALGASAVGGMYGGIAGVGMTPGWEQTFAQAEGEQMCVSVRTDDPHDIERARKALPGTHPVRVDAYGTGR